MAETTTEATAAADTATEEPSTAETSEISASAETPPGVKDPPNAGAVNTSAETVVQVDGLSKHYGPIRAVDGISFTVRRGDILGFLGPNGAGKTTAMRLITGFLEPDSGSVEVAGHNMATDSLAARQRIGYLPENAPAYGEMTAAGFLEFIAEARGVSDIPGAIAKVVGMTGLGKVLHQPIETLSKGFKRRVGLAQALIHDPEVLILDEPTDGLDPNQKAMVQDLIGSLSRNKCIILSTHILDEVERVCNRAMIISEGKILVDSTPQELVAQAPSHNVIRLAFEEPQGALVERIAELPWCERVEASSDTEITITPINGENHLAELLSEVKEIPLRGVHLDEGRLDELFRSITQGVSQ